jgi:replication-associated recombination protein RarA
MIDQPRFDPDAPRSVDDLVGNDSAWKPLHDAITADRAANIILVGPPGCGKSLFLRFALAGRRVLNIECTANSGLRDVRDSIHFFACGAKTAGDHLRWVVFEHADMLTSDTQAFLRRMLETTAETTRFVFECRDIGAISEPILSRATIVNLSAPDDTELLYEIKRRTGFTIDASVADQICALSYGNLRTAVLYALAFKHCGAEFVHAQVTKLLSERPAQGAEIGAWVSWAITCEESCRSAGIDLRDILRLGWPSHPVVNNTMSTWSRLGGTSPRTLFFDCIYQISAL